MHKGIVMALASMGLTGLVNAQGMVPLTDVQLSETTGQALMSLNYIDPAATKNPMKGIVTNGQSNKIGFYKLGMEAEIELNANIKNLQLGCGGVNGAGSCDIDIKNLSLSGLPSSYDAVGNPVYSEGRASTSGKMTNPFMEFAISNPESSSTRELKGIRFSAEKIDALLSAGVNNGATASTTDGIQNLSGFMQIAATSGTAVTKPTVFGTGSNQALTGYANISGLGNASFVSDPSKSVGIAIPSMNVNFNIPQFTVNGVRNTKAVVNDILTNISSIPLDSNRNDSLYVNLGCSAPGAGLCGLITGVVPNTTFKMDAGSNITNLNMNITFEQALSMIHNIPLTGTGGYLAMQSTSLLWPGATIAVSDIGKTSLADMSNGTDVAKTGWWMSFAQEVQLGKLNVTNPVSIDSVLPQVSTLVSSALQKSPYTYVNFGSAIGALTGSPITQKINVDLGSYTQSNPATMTLLNQQLNNQNVVSNCYGSLKFC